MNKSTHILIIPLVFIVVHWTQLGTELVTRILGSNCPASLRTASEMVTTVSLWLLVLYLVPCGAKLILWVYALGGALLDLAVAHGKSALIEMLEWLIDVLKH